MSTALAPVTAAADIDNAIVVALTTAILASFRQAPMATVNSPSGIDRRALRAVRPHSPAGRPEDVNHG